jgi:hypothetical protein
LEEKTQGEFRPLVQTQFEEEVPQPEVEPYAYDEQETQSILDVVSDAVSGRRSGGSNGRSSTIILPFSELAYRLLQPSFLSSISSKFKTDV